MRALVVHESMFGCTRSIAQAIASGLADEGADVACRDVRDVSTTTLATDADLLVVAAPTHAFGLSRASTRASANEQGAHWDGDGIREWIDRLPRHVDARFATVDTKVRTPNLPGSAGGAAQRALAKHGACRAADHESFWITGTKGPLLDGELERARMWGRSLAVSAKAA